MLSDKIVKSTQELLKDGVQKREQITQLYVKYHELSKLATDSCQIVHMDLKRAVDAIHYFGGGWPSEKSKGRMEALLDNFVGMYRVLDFIGSGSMVTNHLAKYGVTVNMLDAYKLQDADLSENEIKFITTNFNYLNSEHVIKTKKQLITAIVLECDDLQGQICKLADIVKEDVAERIIDECNIEKTEFDRLFQVARIKAKSTPEADEKSKNRKSKIYNSFSNFNTVVRVV